MSVRVGWRHLFPETWDFLPSKRLFPESKKRAHPDDEQLTASQDWGVIPQREFVRRAGRRVVQINQHLEKRKRVELDDFVISMRSFQGGLERAWASGGIRSSYVVLRPSSEVHVGYFARLFKCQQYIQALQATAHFIRDGQDLNYQNFCLVDLPLPPREEQTQIAKFLDYETAKIDALIEKQQQLIALLKEKRQAVISHAVTKGLNPDAPMRDSGVEWLGAIPEHWAAKRLKFVVTHTVDCHHSTPGYDPDAAFPALRTADVHPGFLDVDGARRVHREEYLERISRLKPEAGDIIYSREGERWGIAALVPIGVDLCLAQRVMLFRSSTEMESAFLMWALNSPAVYNQLAVNVVGATSPHVNIGDIKEVWVPVPPTNEQDQIRDRLEVDLSRMDRIIDAAFGIVQVLNERRASLISAAVTGKIDVRRWTQPETGTEAA